MSYHTEDKQDSRSVQRNAIQRLVTTIMHDLNKPGADLFTIFILVKNWDYFQEESVINQYK